MKDLETDRKEKPEFFVLWPWTIATVLAITFDSSVRFLPIIPFRKRLEVLYNRHSFAVTACGEG